MHCVKSVQIRSFFWSVFPCIRTEYGAEKTPYLNTFHAVSRIDKYQQLLKYFGKIILELTQISECSVALYRYIVHSLVTVSKGRSPRLGLAIRDLTSEI